MKNLILGFVILLVTVSFANTGESVKKQSEVTAITELVMPLTVESVVSLPTETVETAVLDETNADDDDALYCSVVIDGHRHTCWFCDCAEFIKALTAVQ